MRWFEFDTLLPATPLARFRVDTVSCNDRQSTVRLWHHAPKNSLEVTRALQDSKPDNADVLRLELADSSLNDLHLNVTTVTDLI